MSNELRFTMTRRRTDVKFLEEYVATPERLAEVLKTFRVGEKDGTALIPAVFNKCPETCRNHGNPKKVDCGGSHSHRLGANVREMTMLGADLDDVNVAQFNGIIQSLISKGFEFYWWNTHSHKHDDEAGKVRARILIPFNEPLPLREAWHWSKAAWPSLMEAVGLPYDALDPSCTDPARVYYMPACPSASDLHKSEFVEGKPLSWRSILGDSIDKLPAVETLAPYESVDEDPLRPVDLEDLKQRLKDSKSEISRRAGRGVALSPPPHKRKSGEVSRYQAWRTATAALSMMTEGWESTAALLELLRPSWLVEVAECPEDHTDFETVTSLLQSARASAPGRKAADLALQNAFKEAFIRRTTAAPFPVDLPLPKEDNWETELQFEKTKKGQPLQLKNSSRNMGLILNSHPQWKGALRKNLLTQEVEIWRGPLLREGQPCRGLQDNDAVFTQWWLSQHYSIEPSVASIWGNLLAVGAQNEHDPLQSYLRSLKWDGVPRAKNWLVQYTGAPTVDATGASIEKYLEAIGTRWLISAVARALRPGCKVDTMLTFEGLQGKRKSTLLNALGGEFFSDAPVDFHDKDSLLHISRYWIVELAEVASLRRSEVAVQRAFLSRKVDDFRPPYGRSIIRLPRRCVFIGTANEDDYLQDDAGNRRHWPVATGTMDVEGLLAIRDQLWAEAVTLFDAGEQWHLTPEEQLEANKQTTQRMYVDLFAEKISAWLLAQPQEKRPTFVSTIALCQEALEESPTRGLEMRLSRALRRLGFTRARQGVTRGYAPPPELLEAPVQARHGLRALPRAERSEG